MNSCSCSVFQVLKRNPVAIALPSALHHLLALRRLHDVASKTMIIDAKAIILTLAVVTIGCYFGLQFVRQFALQIARENHDAILAMDQAEDTQRRKRERAAEAAEASAFARVQPILTNPAIDVSPDKSSSPSIANSASV
jgi:hypothetical protein